MTKWHDIQTAPKDGRIIRIAGRRFKTGRRYIALAVWTTRKCPHVKMTGWFPPTDRHDGAGPFLEVYSWQEYKDDHA